MNRVLFPFLALIILFAFSGCELLHAKPNDTGNIQSSSISAENSTVPVVTDGNTSLQIPTISVSMPIVRETQYANDDAEIFSYAYQNMSLILPEPEVAEAIIIDFSNRVDKTSANADSIRAAAKADYNAGNWTPYLCEIIYNPMRIDSGVLSLLGNYASYSGTPHPESVDVSVSYDLVTGKVIALDDIFPKNAEITLSREVIEVLRSQKEEKYLFDDFEETVTDRFENGLSHENSWYFSNTGLCFYFSAYDIAPYSSGMIVAEIAYEKLAGLMNDAYFPAELESVNGTLSAELFNEDRLDEYDIFSEITIEKGATKALMYTDSSIYDVRIETGSWSADGEMFIPQHTVYAAYALTKDSLIIVESEIPDTLPRLRITYRAGGRSECLYLTDSGKDGSVYLTK